MKAWHCQKDAKRYKICFFSSNGKQNFFWIGGVPLIDG